MSNKLASHLRKMKSAHREITPQIERVLAHVERTASPPSLSEITAMLEGMRTSHGRVSYSHKERGNLIFTLQTTDNMLRGAEISLREMDSSGRVRMGMRILDTFAGNIYTGAGLIEFRGSSNPERELKQTVEFWTKDLRKNHERKGREYEQEQEDSYGEHGY